MRIAATALASCLLLLGAGAAVPAAAQSESGERPSTELEAVTITVGRGQLRSVHRVGRSELQTAAISGQNPLLTVARLPGVNVQSADALGNYEWSARFTVRGFSQNQLGFTLDGVPLGDMSYGNLNGLHIGRAIASENVAGAELSQGTGALDTPSSSNLGGTLQFFSDAPERRFGLRAAQTLGSHANRRTHLRLDSGDTALGSAYLSATQQAADKWKGAGQQRQRQLNLKAQKAWDGGQLTAFFNHSSREEIDDQDLSLEMIQRLGPRWDNTYPDFNAALRAAQALCGNGNTAYVPQCDDAYYAGAGLRRDLLAGVNLETALAPAWRLQLGAYHHGNDGRGLWYTPYTPSPDGTPISLRTTEYAIHRRGATAALQWDLGAHQVRAAFWHEDNDFDQARRFYATPPGAVPSPYAFPRDPFLTQWAYRFHTRTQQASLSDTLALSPTLTLGAGFKALSATIDAERLLGTGPAGAIRAQRGFLPQLGLNWQVNAVHELFAGAQRNLRAFQASATGASPFATTQAGFDAIRDTLRPETATTVELGWRATEARYQAALTLYGANFRDRLLAVTPGSAIVGNPAVLANVGGVRARGLEATLSLRLHPGWTLYNSLSLNRSTYRDDVQSRDAANQPITVPLAGKDVVDAPRTMAKSILSAERGPWFGELGLDFMARRFYSHTNDAAVPARTLLNASAGLRLGPWLGWTAVRDASLRLAVTNLGNRRYVATVGTNGFPNSDPSGTNQTLLMGAPRQLMLSLSGRI
ncbi:TonB-dependent receptor [Inhella crocodyli]|nr:TonB-dependent receptor [Inhella crocodyli]